MTGDPNQELYLEGVIGESDVMKDLSRLVRRVAPTRATLRIRGASGTGKELVARAVHSLSSCRDHAFITVDCANIPSSLMESELFGHERGAFTDASAQKKGLIELADNGTVFFDEIGILPIELQAKLLNVLETQRFRRVGGTEELQMNVRFLAATNEDMEAAVEEGRFREDLYHRLNVVPIDLPPLRDRGGDVLIIAAKALKEFTELHGAEPRRLGTSAHALLIAYSWPGNVRELRNVMERAVLMTDRSVIRADDLIIDRRTYRNIKAASSAISVDAEGHVTVVLPAEGMSLEAVERELILAALEKAHRNVTQAASLLGLSRDTLRYRINKYSLAPDSVAEPV